MPKITKRLVDSLGPEDTGRIVRDDELIGFGVRRNSDGSKTYLLQYRPGRGRKVFVRREKVGKHGALTPDEARRLARQMLARVAAGKDPALDRIRRQGEPTVKDVLLTAVEQHWKPKRKASTAKAFEEMINRT